MWQEWLKDLLARHRGKVIGAGLGFLAGLLLMLVGFFWALVIAALTIGGYLLGRRYDDDRAAFADWLERFFGGR